MTAERCALCLLTGGHMGGNTHRPTRTDTTKHGLPGVCCHSCATLVRYRAKHGLDPRTGKRRGAA